MDGIVSLYIDDIIVNETEVTVEVHGWWWWWCVHRAEAETGQDGETAISVR